MSHAAPTTAAFFDFDNTLVYGDSQTAEIRHLRSRRALSPATALMLDAAMDFQARRWISADQLNRIYLRIYRGKSPEMLRRQGLAIYRQRLAARMIPWTVALLAAHRRAGHTTVIVSASLRHLLLPAAAAVGADHLICTPLAWGTDGRATGRLAGPTCIGDHKRQAARRLARRLDIDLSASWAYSDHHDDAPLLLVVGHPVAVRPTRRLAAMADRRAWPRIGSPRR